MHKFAPDTSTGRLKAYHLLIREHCFCSVFDSIIVFLLPRSLVRLIVAEREQISKMARKYLGSHDLSFIKAILLCTLEEIRNKSLIVRY